VFIEGWTPWFLSLTLKGKGSLLWEGSGICGIFLHPMSSRTSWKGSDRARELRPEDRTEHPGMKGKHSGSFPRSRETVTSSQNQKGIKHPEAELETKLRFFWKSCACST
jgi:hypothetical protein